MVPAVRSTSTALREVPDDGGKYTSRAICLLWREKAVVVSLGGETAQRFRRRLMTALARATGGKDITRFL